MKRVIVSGGGTGGHIFPALSIANALKRLQPDIEILFVGAEGKMEMEKVPEAGYRIEGLPVRGLKRKLTLENVKVLYNLWKSLRKARKIIREFPLIEDLSVSPEGITILDTVYVPPLM